MANYPSSVFAPATHNTGDIIQASDVNNPNNEIVALEQDLVNGALRVNLTPSTDVAKNIGSASFRWQNFYSSALYALDVSSRSNYVSITAAITGVSPTIAATGASDANIGLTLLPKGTGGIGIGNATNGPVVLTVAGTGIGFKYRLQIGPTATGIQTESGAFVSNYAGYPNANLGGDGTVASNPPLATSGTTTQNGQGLFFTSSYWTGTAANLKDLRWLNSTDVNGNIIAKLSVSSAYTTGSSPASFTDQIWIDTQAGALLAGTNGSISLGYTNDHRFSFCALSQYLTVATISAPSTTGGGIRHVGPIEPDTDIGTTLGIAARGYSRAYLRGTGGVIRFDDTTIMGVTLKKGSGAGNYTTTSTTYVDVDATNLAYAVTVPTGWKALVSWSGAVFQSTAIAIVRLALADGTTTLVESEVEGPAAGSATNFNLQWVFTGDGASHTFKPRFLTSNASDAAGIVNSSATELSVMTVTLMPSN